ncbi:MAG: CoA-binding protein [Amylibacter sp.]
MTDRPSHTLLRKILTETKAIACIGVSPNPIRPSYYVARYLHVRSYRMIPVKPGQVGKELFGEPFRGDIADLVGEPVDMIDIFRRPEAVPAIVDDALNHLMPSLKTVWMQIGVRHAEATAKAQAHGLQVVQNLCPKIEHQRLFGELRKAGFNTGIISSKL